MKDENRWRQIQKNNFTQWQKLAQFLQLDEKYFLKSSPFSLNLPVRLAEKIQKNCPDDPILRQFLPTPEEQKKTNGFFQDPVSDVQFKQGHKLLKKYQGRALMVTTGACAMNCRFCFRQNFDYPSQEKGFDTELKIISEDTSLREIILSGGDPLSLSNETLGQLIERLSDIPHLRRLRFHTRFPIGIPERIDLAFLDILQATRLQVFFVIHCNHPHELDADIFHALKKIQHCGIPVLNHTVLLKGVNDQASVLKNLYEQLVDNGILPYYLNQLDKVQGAAHFEVDERDGLKIIDELRNHLSGYAVPKYSKEIPGMPSKTPIVNKE